MVKAKLDWKLVEKILPDFEEFLKSEEAQEWEKERKNKDKIFKEYFATSKLSKLEKMGVDKWIRASWSYKNWANKDYLIYIIMESKIENIRKAFKTLFDQKKPVGERVDFANSHIKQVGAAGISELLIHYNCKKYPIWNRRAKESLVVLGIKEDQLPPNQQVKGAHYISYCEQVDNIWMQLQKKSEVFKDLFVFNYFLYYIAT